jgi:hypothetical protein
MVVDNSSIKFFSSGSAPVEIILASSCCRCKASFGAVRGASVSGEAEYTSLVPSCTRVSNCGGGGAGCNGGGGGEKSTLGTVELCDKPTTAPASSRGGS